ncbi:hypothetical protein BASA83_012173 [Batrachochytrium salamandrivorans]|nr:hypothetical protein BASA83_012173 [Batrachochytrium salamandrivorans]
MGSDQVDHSISIPASHLDLAKFNASILASTAARCWSIDEGFVEVRLQNKQPRPLSFVWTLVIKTEKNRESVSPHIVQLQDPLKTLSPPFSIGSPRLA